MLVWLQKQLEHLHPQAWDVFVLLRLNRPIGIYLLLWPTLWALWIAGNGHPSTLNVLIFVLGVILTRSAGCALNDYMDRHFDGQVQRTQFRPLVAGRLQPKTALRVALVLLVLSALLLVFTNILTVFLAFGALVLMSLYPLMKRYTYYPQGVLGAAYSWGILMAFSAQTGNVPALAFWLYAANLLWTVAYDTYYAMVDRDDDVRVGIKSTAIALGHWDLHVIFALQVMALLCLCWTGYLAGFSDYFYVGLAAALFCFIWEIYVARSRQREACFAAFLHSHWAGLCIWLGLVLEYTQHN